jgi:hypothetical protein
MVTGYCIIRNNTIVLNGRIIFRDEQNDLATFLSNAYASLGVTYPKFYKMDHLSQLGFLATEMVLKNRKLTEEYKPEEIALVLSNRNSSLDTDLRYWQSVKTAASPSLFVYTLPNIVAGELCIRHGIKGESAFFISGEFDASLMTSYVNMVLTESPCACLAGWVDVLGGQHDVFLYLLEKNKPGLLDHTAEQLNDLYQRTLWNN